MTRIDPLADVPDHVREHLMRLVRCWPEAKQRVKELSLEERLEEVRSGKTPSKPKVYPQPSRERDWQYDIAHDLHFIWDSLGGKGVGIKTDEDGLPQGPFLEFVQALFLAADVDPPDWRMLRRYITGH
jgi:hypothetical protein